jgi:N-acetylglucosamine-6-sulfatase
MPIPATPRRRSASILVLIAVVGVVLVTETPSEARAHTRALRHPPNVLVIVTDDQTIDTWSAMPQAAARIRDRGMSFTRAFVSNPECCPSRATIFTGGYSHTTGVYSNFGNEGGFRAFYRNGDEDRTIAAYLDRTYETALFGKYLNGYRTYANRHLRRGYVPPAWDEWQAFYEDNGAYYGYNWNRNGHLRHYGHTARDFSTDMIGRHVRDWLDPSDGDGRRRSQPFFAYVAAYAAHGPAEASPRFHDDQRFLGIGPVRSPAVRERDVRDKPTYIRRLPRLSDADRTQLLKQWRHQHQALFSYDRQIGLILDVLRKQHELHDTVVILASDNGQTYGEHRWTFKLVPYDRSIRVPFVIRYDRFLHERKRVNRRDIVSNVDIFSTVMALTRGPAWKPPHRVDGRPLRPVLLGNQRGPFRHALLLESLYHRRNTGPGVPTYCGVLTRKWKYVVYSATGPSRALVTGSEDSELYNRARDPYELHNVVRSRPGIVRRLRDRLHHLCSPPPPGWSVHW